MFRWLRYRWRAIAAVFALAPVLAASCVEAPPVRATPAPAQSDSLWSANHESGDLSEWNRGGGGGLFTTGAGAAKPSTDVAHSGRYSVAMTVTARNGQPQAARLFRWAESEQNAEAYYSAWYYFPRSYRPDSWWNVFQWKSKLSATTNDPLWILNVGNRPSGEMYFYLYDWMSGRSYGQSEMNIPVGQWFQLEAYYRQATDDTGQIIVWENGVKILDVDGVRTKRAGDQVQWSLDNYTDGISPAVATIYVDDAAMSTTRLGSGMDFDLSLRDSPGSPGFVLGFKAMADLLGSMAGYPLENEHFDPDNGNSIQRTTRGLMVWRGADNWTAFTDGRTTWINGPYGLQSRPNEASFSWESPGS